MHFFWTRDGFTAVSAAAAITAEQRMFRKSIGKGEHRGVKIVILARITADLIRWKWQRRIYLISPERKVYCKLSARFEQFRLIGVVLAYIVEVIRK